MTSESDAGLSPEMVQALLSQDAAAQLKATVHVRERLSIKSSATDEFIKFGLVPRFVHFLEDSRHPELQCEAAKVLAKVASGTTEQTQVVIDAGAVASLISLLSSSNLDIAEQSVLALGNIAADSPQSVLNRNVVSPLLRYDDYSLCLICRLIHAPLQTL